MGHIPVRAMMDDARRVYWGMCKNAHSFSSLLDAKNKINLGISSELSGLIIDLINSTAYALTPLKSVI
jgi:hypothetical protein